MNYMWFKLITLTINSSWADAALRSECKVGGSPLLHLTASIGALELIYRVSLPNFVVQQHKFATESGSPIR
jgi:hypothetical protein